MQDLEIKERQFEERVREFELRERESLILSEKLLKIPVKSGVETEKIV